MYDRYIVNVIDKDYNITKVHYLYLNLHEYP